MKNYQKNGMYQVRYCTPFKTVDGRLVDHWHETRVFANDEVDAECKVADMHPDGYAFWAVNVKDITHDMPHAKTWSGSY